MSNDPLEQYRLVDNFIRGTLSESDAQRLAEIVQNDPEVARLLAANVDVDFLLKEKSRAKRELLPSTIPSYIQLDTELDTCLRQWSKPVTTKPVHVLDMSGWDELIAQEKAAPPLLRIPEPQDSEMKNEKEKKTKPRKRHSSWGLIITSVSLVLLIGAAELFEVIQRNSASVTTMVSNEVATVRGLLNTQWDTNFPMLKKGQLLEPNEYSFLKGAIQLSLTSGVELVIEGPAHFSIVDSNNIFCTQGKISAHVPSNAIGFAIRSPHGSFIDRGTDFSVSIDHNSSKIEVFKGRVDACYSNQIPISLTSGKGLIRTLNQQIQTLAVVPENYFSTAMFDKKSEESFQQIQKLNDDKISTLCQDKSVQYVCNLWKSGNEIKTDQKGTQIGSNGCREVEGRFKGTKAVYFGNQDDRLIANIPNIYYSMTFVVTLRLDRLVNMGNVIVMSDEFDTKSQKINWQIGKKGNLFFYISNDRGGIHMKSGRMGYDTFMTPVCFTQNDWGTWSQLALVIDGNRRRITQYKDGKIIASLPWNNASTLAPGRLNIGNADSLQKGQNPRFLGGAIDEFMIFNRALSTNEIMKLNRGAF